MPYPTFNQVLGSDPAYIDDRQIDQDVNGAAHIRSFFTARKTSFTIKHLLSRTDYATLLTFYDANRNSSFTFVWNLDNSSHTVIFAAVPKCSTSNDPLLLDVTVMLRDA